MRMLRVPAVFVVLAVTGCATAGGSPGVGTSESPAPSASGSAPPAPTPTATATPRLPIAGGQGFHLQLTYTYEVTLQLLPGATGSSTGTDTFEGDLLPAEPASDGQATRYEGNLHATSTGTSHEDLAGIVCDAEWSGTQELSAVAELVPGSDLAELDLTFRARSAPTYEIRTPGGDICPGVHEPVDADGQPMLPFGDAIIAGNVPLALLLPEEPGEQRIPIQGTITGSEQVDAEWHAVWSEPEG